MSFDEEPEGDPHGECAKEIKALRDLVKAQEELLSRYRLGTRRGIEGILDRITTAKETLGWK